MTASRPAHHRQIEFLPDQNGTCLRPEERDLRFFP